LGNKLIEFKLLKVEKLIFELQDNESIEDDVSDDDDVVIDNDSKEPNPPINVVAELKLPSESEKPTAKKDTPDENYKDKSGYKPGDTIEFEF